MVSGAASAQRYSLWLEGQDSGRLHSVEGGEPYGEVVALTYPPPGRSIEKAISAVHYVDIALACSAVPPAPLMGWISGMLGGLAPVHAGAVVPEQAYTKQARLEFTNAVIREVEFPGLNAAARQPVYMTVRVAPGLTRRVSGSQPSSVGAVGSSLYSSDFTLKIPGLDCSHVAEIGPLVVSQTPNGLDVADLVVTLPEDEDWYDWRDDLLGATHLGYASPFRKTGTLEYISRQALLARIDFTGLGIHSLVVEPATASATRSNRRMRVSMFCESLRYTVVAPPPTADATTKLIEASGGAIPSRVDAIAPLAARLLRPTAPG